MGNFKELRVWQKSIELTQCSLDISETVARLRPIHKYSLCTQICKSAISVASNIAEGSGRSTLKDFSHFLDMARGSLNELETQLIIAESFNQNIDVATFKKSFALIDDIGRMLTGLKKSTNISDA